MNIICCVQQFNTAKLNSSLASISLLERKRSVKYDGNMIHDFKSSYCSVTYHALVINCFCLLELPLLSVTVANCRRKAEGKQKPCCAAGIEHNTKNSHKCSSDILEPTQSGAISQNLFSCCNNPQTGRHTMILRVYEMG